MNTLSLSDRQHLDAFCRDLALALRRITGREVDVDKAQLSTTDPKQSDVMLVPKAHLNGDNHDSR